MPQRARKKMQNNVEITIKTEQAEKQHQRVQHRRINHYQRKRRE